MGSQYEQFLGTRISQSSIWPGFGPNRQKKRRNGDFGEFWTYIDVGAGEPSGTEKGPGGAEIGRNGPNGAQIRSQAANTIDF